MHTKIALQLALDKAKLFRKWCALLGFFLFARLAFFVVGFFVCLYLNNKIIKKNFLQLSFSSD